MFLQDFPRTLRLSINIATVLTLFCGCSLFESSSTATIAPSLPPRPSVSTNEQGTTVAVEQFKPKEKATDVLIELTVDTSSMEKLIIKYGSNPESLNLEKVYGRSELQIAEDAPHTQISIRIKDAGSITPLYVSSAIESSDEVRSEFSAPVLVTGTVE